MGNNYFQKTVLTMKFISEGAKTILKDYYFTSPLKILPAIPAEHEFTRVMILSSSGGIMAGDTQEHTIDIGENCKVEITSQSYEKIHKMMEGKATRVSNITVGAGATLNYNPQPTIPYAKSAFDNTTNIHLADDTAKLVYTEVLSAGRVHHGEKFGYTFYKTLTNVYKGEDLIYCDNTFYDPKLLNMEGYGLYEGYTHLSNIFIANFGDAKATMKSIRNILAESNEDIDFGVSVTESDDVVVRIFGYEGNTLELLNKKIFDSLYAEQQ